MGGCAFRRFSLGQLGFGNAQESVDQSLKLELGCASVYLLGPNFDHLLPL